MPTRHSQTTDDSHRVVAFRPRSPAHAGQPESSDPDGHDSRAHTSPDDYRHRIIVNLVAIVFVILLAALGVWLATSLRHMWRTQDCVMRGLRDCSRISSNMPPGWSSVPTDRIG